ncbi:MAG: hypothetical protein DRR19_05315 [Candidatus Parabeggiatoa sp. nov. 1]|nr:MAG: hypothetical protein DRR19_05315 [Gammaproteobacteria bacterium]
MTAQRLTPTKPKLVFLMMMSFFGSLMISLPILAFPMKLLENGKVLLNGVESKLCPHCKRLERNYSAICDAMVWGSGHSVPYHADGKTCACPCPCSFGQEPNINFDISPMIHPSRRLIQFYINNHESRRVLCRYIKVYVDYRDNKNKEIGRRRATINDVILEPNLLQFQVEAGKEIIDNLEAQYDTPRIHSIYGEPEYDCCY